MGKFDFHFSTTVENDKKKKEKEISENEYNAFEFQKIQKKMREKIKTKEEIDALKDLIESGIIDGKTVESILSGNEIGGESLKELFEKIDEIVTINDKNILFPKQYIFTKEEYMEALSGGTMKNIILQKIDHSLDYMYAVGGGGNGVFGLFSLLSYYLLFSRNFQNVQSNLIDLKDNLNKI